MKVTFKVEGFQELDQALAELVETAGVRNAKNAAKRGLVEALEPVAQRARDYAPERTGLLKSKIAVGTSISNPIGKFEYRQVLRRGGSKREAGQAMRAARATARAQGEAGSSVEAYAGVRPLPYAHMVEFGSVNNTPHPFLRPAWDETKGEVLERIKVFVWAQIKKAAARAARKAARRAARAGG